MTPVIREQVIISLINLKLEQVTTVKANHYVIVPKDSNPELSDPKLDTISYFIAMS